MTRGAPTLHAASPLLPALDSGKSQARKPKRERKTAPATAEAPGLPKDWLELSAGCQPLPPIRPIRLRPPPPRGNVVPGPRPRRPVRLGACPHATHGNPRRSGSYAERARIASYFHMGDTLDRDGAAHPAWLGRRLLARAPTSTACVCSPGIPAQSLRDLLH